MEERKEMERIKMENLQSSMEALCEEIFLTTGKLLKLQDELNNLVTNTMWEILEKMRENEID